MNKHYYVYIDILLLKSFLPRHTKKKLSYGELTLLSYIYENPHKQNVSTISTQTYANTETRSTLLTHAQKTGLNRGQDWAQDTNSLNLLYIYIHPYILYCYTVLLYCSAIAHKRIRNPHNNPTRSTFQDAPMQTHTHTNTHSLRSNEMATVSILYTPDIFNRMYKCLYIIIRFISLSVYLHGFIEFNKAIRSTRKHTYIPHPLIAKFNYDNIFVS